jgi:hypothetical protein
MGYSFKNESEKKHTIENRSTNQNRTNVMVTNVADFNAGVYEIFIDHYKVTLCSVPSENFKPSNLSPEPNWLPIQYLT